MTADKLRKEFLSFFKSKGHAIVESDSLIPSKFDPTVLFTSAGMNQFKEQFLGQNITFRRAASSQKCLRTPDLERVGKTAGHHTFFEMLGNFSFGDYFKKEAISWAWEFMVDVLKLPEERLWVSVYRDDDEAYEIWQKKIKVPAHKIMRFGEAENFWPAEAPTKGPNGPCGPCSEIFYDQGKNIGCGRPDCNPSCDCDRFVEVWNLVFTQFNRVGLNKLEPLANKNIDTGMGLERLAAVVEGKLTNYETDLFAPIIEAIGRLIPSNKRRITPPSASPLAGPRQARSAPGGANDELVRAIADHARACVFLIADGVLPSNEERGYVGRMLIRRAYRFGRQIGIEGPFLYKLVPVVGRVMKVPYPEIEGMREDIAQVILSEEEKFQNTLVIGTEVLETLIGNLKKEARKEISGRDAFRLYDTYGFPLELTRDFAKQEELNLDEEGFKQALEKQRELSRKGSGMEGAIFAPAIERVAEGIKTATKFLGYKTTQADARIVAIIKGNKKVKEISGAGTAEIILDQTPFYAEAGGQIGDTGLITKGGFEFRVKDTKKVGKVYVHIGEAVKGKAASGARVKAEVDKEKRSNIARNHTATHLLHWALRKVLGNHVKQAGSLVAPDRLRFDFMHFRALADREIERVEELVNENILADEKLTAETLQMQEAKKKGAIALFGEKYGKMVRMVAISDFSKELCGGTHVDTTANIGLFKIISEGSIASGIRRVEAVTGKAALANFKEAEARLNEAAGLLKTSPDKVIDVLGQIQLRLKEFEKRCERSQLADAKAEVEEIIKRAAKVGEIFVVAEEVKEARPELLRSMADEIKKKLASCVIVFGSAGDGRVLLTCSASADLVGRGFHAGNFIKEVAKVVGGTGGGRPDFAQAGGKEIGKLKEALAGVAALVEKVLFH